MKKRLITKVFFFADLFCFSLFAFGIFMTAVAIQNGWLDVLVFLVPVSVISFPLFLYEFFLKFPSGRFSVTKEGITMYIGFKRYDHPWNRVTEFDILPISAGDGDLYFIYFAGRPLPSARTKKEALLKYCARGERLNDVAYFQYNKKSFASLMACVPPEIGEVLQVKIDEIIPRMTWIERLYHT